MTRKSPQEWALEEFASRLGLSQPLRDARRFATLGPSQVDEFVALAMALEGIDPQIHQGLAALMKAIVQRHLGAQPQRSDA